MATASSILDLAQTYLHDDGTIWTPAELLNYLNEGYARLLTRTAGCRSLIALDVPPRPQYAISQPWERQYVSGSIFEWTWADNLNGSRSAYEWEAEQELGFAPATSQSTYTFPWERIYASGAVREEVERYVYPDDHLRTFRIAFNGQRVPSVSTRELDAVATRWEVEVSDPTWYHGGFGRQKEFATYPAASGYVENIVIQEGGYGTIGTYSGGRTYSTTQLTQEAEGYAFTTTGDVYSGALVGPGRKITTDTTVAADYQAMFSWEKQHVEGTAITAGTGYLVSYGWEAAFVSQSHTYMAGFGNPYNFSGLRQYVVTDQVNPGADPMGTIGDWKSSENALLVDYALSAPELTESDSPDLLPTSFAKYLRFYTLARAFGRDGEGRNPVLSDHFMQRFEMGVTLLRRLADFARWAALHQHGTMTPLPSRPGRPRLPSTYPRIR